MLRTSTVLLRRQMRSFTTFLFRCNKLFTPVKNFIAMNLPVKFIGFTNLALMTVHCEKLADVREASSEKLTHEDCIKQACLISANSATTLLTTATTAILDICYKYEKSLSSILMLCNELLLTKGEIQEMWETMVESRGEVEKMKAALLEMKNYMSTVEKVVNSTTEAAFLAGSEYLCTILCERLYSAQQEISKNMNEIKKLEEDFLKVQEELAKTIKKND